MLVKLKKIMTVFLLLAVAGLVALPGSLHAQEFLFQEKKEEKKYSAEEVFNQLPPDIQDKLLEETGYVFDYCNGKGLFSSLHDCRCVAAEFFDERVLNYNPQLRPITVADRLASKCPNETGTAGFGYKQCISSFASQMDYGLEEFCTCYGNTFSRLFAEDPRAFTPHLTSIASTAISQCKE